VTAPPRGPFPPCHQYRNFLAEEERSALLDWTLANRERFAAARLFGNVLDPSRRIAQRLADLGSLRPVLERRLTDALPEIFRHTGTRPFEVEHIELEIGAHGDGAFFAHHSDIPLGVGRKPIGGNASGTQDRLISGVYYYHSEPRRFSGGSLRLYRFGDPAAEGDFVEFEPEQNSLVVFPSWARHEVRRVDCPGCDFPDYRFAVNAWLCRTLASSVGQAPARASH
jgi:Rps23 Pro-64 3,4-dihydroxylase Tpa1-like proline 4-hydroxylase